MMRPEAKTVPGQAASGGMGGARIYYLHPLLAGPPGGWGSQFARIAALGFTHVLLAPPFQPDASGLVFATADFATLHPALGGGDATAALAAAVIAAEQAGLRLLLDLVVRPRAADVAGTAPPDPRWSPQAGGPPDWDALLATWRDAGIAGYRCDAPQRAPGRWAAEKRKPKRCPAAASIWRRPPHGRGIFAMAGLPRTRGAPDWSARRWRCPSCRSARASRARPPRAP
jgi:starch synthase (maltosyl-transferring)